jgi:hypothetical protein
MRTPLSAPVVLGSRVAPARVAGVGPAVGVRLGDVRVAVVMPQAYPGKAVANPAGRLQAAMA